MSSGRGGAQAGGVLGEHALTSRLRRMERASCGVHPEGAMRCGREARGGVDISDAANVGLPKRRGRRMHRCLVSQLCGIIAGLKWQNRHVGWRGV